MKKSIITLLIALVSISAFGRTATRKEARMKVEYLYIAMQGTMNIDSLYDIVCPLEYAFEYRRYDYSPIVLKEALSKIMATDKPVLFRKICDQVNYEMDYPDYDYVKRYKKVITGTTDLNYGKMYKRLNENYSGANDINSPTVVDTGTQLYWSEKDKCNKRINVVYSTTVTEIPFTQILFGYNEYCIQYNGLEKDWPKYEEKINELIKVITTF